MNTRTDQDWVYVKLYLGRAVDRMDRLLVALGAEPVLNERARSWFYIRYVDERGIHVRVRALAREGDRDALGVALVDTCARCLNALPGYPPGEYHPTVAVPGFEASVAAVTHAHNDIDVIEDRYAAETDKFGARPAMDIAEQVFDDSSRLAVGILRREDRGELSRKDLVPILMHEVSAAFIAPEARASFWNEYSYYWLNGRSPAAEDWQQKFGAKYDELGQRGIAIVPSDADLAPAVRELVTGWRRDLRAAAEAYAQASGHGDGGPEVLAFNFAHLMNNRLGLASLEEAYMAALLARLATPALAEEAA